MRKTPFILLSFLLVTSCVLDETTPPPLVVTPGGDEAKPPPNVILTPDQEEQGRYLLGNIADSLTAGGWYFSVDNLTTMPGVGDVTVSVDAEHLVATDLSGNTHTDPAEFEDMVFTSTSGAWQLRIDGLSTDGSRFVLSYSSNGIDWTPYCDPTIDSGAVPYQGRWSTRRYHTDGDILSFGCTASGVTVKCFDWGYSAGSGDPTSPEWKRHQACLTMAGAAYCDNGIPHTRELTPIVIRDFVPGAQPDATTSPPLPVLTPSAATWPPPDNDYYEAAWVAYGPALCLSRLRWASLPIGGPCPNQLPDPRVSDDARAVYCEDLTLAQLRNRNAHFVNGSKPMDLNLYRWENAQGDLVTTVAGYIDETTTITPFSGEPFSGYTYAGSDGILLRNLPGSIATTDVTEVFVQYNPNTHDRVVAPLNAMGKGVTPDHQIGAREGYMLNAPRGSQTVRWALYEDGDDYVTAIANPGGGFVFKRWLGWVTAP